MYSPGRQEEGYSMPERTRLSVSGGHQQIGRNVRQRSPLDDFGLMFHELVIALACSLKPPGVSLYL